MEFDNYSQKSMPETKSFYNIIQFEEKINL